MVIDKKHVKFFKTKGDDVPIIQYTSHSMIFPC